MGTVITKLNQLTRFVVILMLSVLIVAVFLQVLFRFFLDQPLAWTEELARYLLIWITFLGSAYAMALKAHIGTEYIQKFLSPLMNKIVLSIAALLSIFFFVVMVQQGYALAARSMTQTSPTLLVPMGYVYMVIPISGVLLIMNVLHVTWKDITGKE
ncbi:TRAP transporter small permease [Brevibacillus centrosporus]|uniref:TRAP transporter small permease n=1 Tax=Brevibacillus centrosporus TaxID=54910 RepID=UPI00286446CB|nr:TRAP transporter small permease [Brevibacillus nitrificans]MDR7315745.1 TRAP-type C4-dicarboxylate transport system permease small subunit [Brevibacillus nitrificans]